MFQQRRGLCLALATGLLTVSVTGCGQFYNEPMFGDVPMMEVASRSGDLAQSFASSLDPAVGTVSVSGSRVTVEGLADVPVVYDFSETPRTNQVQIQVGEYRDVVRRDELAQPDVAWMAIKLATRMVYGGAKAYIWYWRNHKGDQYNREDAVKAVVYGMLSHGVAGLPGGFLWKRLLPIAWKWVVGEEPIHGKTLGEVFRRFMQDVKEVARIVEEAKKP